MIAVSFPKVNNCDEWAKQLRAARVIVKCPDEMDVKAMCAWTTRDGDKEKQAEYWKRSKNTCIFWDRFHVTSLMRRRLRNAVERWVCIAIDQRGNCEEALFTGR
ncbi:retrotransposon hot spot (RHS) protein [Trypanosoma cruzi]|nr:retrotransposon hot spot (RHS) protein [Trypanosoma cruzi]